MNTHNECCIPLERFYLQREAVRVQREAGKITKSTKILSHMKQSRLEMKRQKKGFSSDKSCQENKLESTIFLFWIEMCSTVFK